ncbi:cytoskeleton protein RodZ [Psychromonas marina]|uniref:Cytoskeleton protein RodZ n=1 Tax=Psychromonas marina TaxID=88364 RepID=A0ABQ6DXF8_9GAMM|nr:RodZ domain-containing protein [Psychromonas marina]GLS89770.1 cytoskeleton protein RodZ [Psychromonas marina]
MKTESNIPTEIIVPLGQALKDARIAASLSVDEVAEQLNFAPSTVRDFEDNLTQILETKKYPVIYLRGYLANYAKLVGLNTLELFVEYQQLASVQKKAKTLPPSDLIIPHTKKRSKALPLFLFFVVLVVAVIYVFQKQLFNSTEQTPPVSESVVQQPADQNSNVLIAKGELSSENPTPEVSNNIVEAPTTVSESNLLESGVAPTTVITTPEPVIVPETEKQMDEVNNSIPEAPVESTDVSNSAVIDNSAEQAVQTAQVNLETLSLAFTADCWTEVFDATGKRIAFGLYQNGRVLSLAGVAPFKLKLGDPSVVEIQYQDQIIEGEFTPGRSAQFSVPLS